MAQRSKGRMIRRDVSRSKKIASLSERAALLFLMLIPHFDSFGKMNGSAHFVKGAVVPLLKQFTIPIINKCLKEINDKTNIRWFEYDGLLYLQSINWENHQQLRRDRMGDDLLPEYSWSTPGVLPHEVEVEVEVEVEGKEEGKTGVLPDFESLFGQFWFSYPTRNGKKIGKEQTRALFEKLKQDEMTHAVIAAKNYAKSSRAKMPVDPQRFLKSRDHPRGFWRDWVEPEEGEWDWLEKRGEKTHE